MLTISIFILFTTRIKILSSSQQCGFPKTVSTMYVALFDTTTSKTNQFSHFFDAIGLIFHHAAASLAICILVTGVAMPDESILDPIIIMCLQHSLGMLL